MWIFSILHMPFAIHGALCIIVLMAALYYGVIIVYFRCWTIMSFDTSRQKNTRTIRLSSTAKSSLTNTELSLLVPSAASHFRLALKWCVFTYTCTLIHCKGNLFIFFYTIFQNIPSFSDNELLRITQEADSSSLTWFGLFSDVNYLGQSLISSCQCGKHAFWLGLSFNILGMVKPLWSKYTQWNRLYCLRS